MAKYLLSFHNVKPRMYIDAILELPVRPMKDDSIWLPGKYITQLDRSFVGYRDMKENGVLFHVQKLSFHPGSFIDYTQVHIIGWVVDTEWNIHVMKKR